MKEIGGYIEFEHYNGVEYHNNAIKLNCSRNALAYLIELHRIKHLFVPYYLCDSVMMVCKKYDVIVTYYHVTEDFLPVLPDADFSTEWLYIVNYYGQLKNEKIKEISKIVKNLIIDNVQAFFQERVPNIPTIYNCRKYFGVADGAYLYSEEKLKRELEKDLSFNRYGFLIGRLEKSANEFYQQYVDNNKLFADAPIKTMSTMTKNILCSLDYERIKKIRTENFFYLHEHLKNINKLELDIPEGAFAYPLLLEKGEDLRKKLQAEKIYIPTLWPAVFDICDDKQLEYRLAKNILPLPIDQRYGEEEMNILIKYIKCKI